jgi:hypothetical protein
MAGNGWLREPQAVVDVADAHLVVPQEREDAEPRLVGQRLEDILQLVDGSPALHRRCSLHIFALTNVSHRRIFAKTNI